jgi:nucleotide-binding universal stress UspA family protein
MKVLIATDGAIEWMPHLPFKTRPDVRVLHVIDTASVRAPFMSQPVIAGIQGYIYAEFRRMEKAAKQIKEQSSQLLKALGLHGISIIDRGRVTETLLKHARRQVSLLAVGSRGLKPLDRFMLGSVSNFAVHHASCSVLVVKQAPHPVKRIVLAIDGSSASEHAVQLLRRLFKPVNGSSRSPTSILICHVIPIREYPNAGITPVKRCIDRLSNSGFILESAIKVGKPAEEILKIADESKADLIVTGAKGMGAIRRMLLGSVSTRIVQHASCSVLVAR